jgi:hypothetical protein
MKSEKLHWLTASENDVFPVHEEKARKRTNFGNDSAKKMDMQRTTNVSTVPVCFSMPTVLHPAHVNASTNFCAHMTATIRKNLIINDNITKDVLSTKNHQEIRRRPTPKKESRFGSCAMCKTSLI